MEIKVKTIKTPAGTFSAPLNPAFSDKLEKCQANEDLFELVDIDGFIDPDAFNEVRGRGLYPAYLEWQKSKEATSVVGNEFQERNVYHNYREQ